MTTNTRIFIDTNNSTVVHALEEERITFRDKQAGKEPTMHIANISRANLKEGSRQQGSGIDVLESVMKEGSFVETTADDLVVKAAAEDKQLNAFADHICEMLGHTHSAKRTQLMLMLRAFDRGHDPIATLEIADENETLIAEEDIPTSVREVIHSRAKELADEFDSNYPDWMDRESLTAKFRTTVRAGLRNLKGKGGKKVSSAAMSIHIGAFLLSRKQQQVIGA